ncbi:MAG: GNAT family N-acetyltransferase [Myxococcales bacterium]|nr:GNAT family N-acetyltransferase [Myxococcota bacterium]MDW8282695.1 GNAT family N-acetyltransferase [Myxococcales bacterium]
MSDDVLIRPACPADVEAMAQLAQELAQQPLLRRYGATPAGLSAELTRLAASPTERGEQLLLVQAAGPGRLLGLARFHPSGTFAVGGYLRLIALLPGHQGRGLGTALLRAVEDAVRAHSRALFLLVSQDNEAAQRFYARRGYQQAGCLPDFVRPGLTEIICWKRL